MAGRFHRLPNRPAVLKPAHKGYLLGIVAAATYGMNPVFALPLLRGGMDAMSVLFFRYILSVPALLIILAARKRTPRTALPPALILCGLGFLMAVSSITLFRSYLFLDVSIASTLLFMYPLMVMLIMVGFFHEKFRLATLLCVLGAIAGVGLLCYVPGSGSVSMTGLALVLGSSLSYALYLVGINRPPVNRIDTLVSTFWVIVAGTVLIGVSILVSGHLALPRGLLQWGCVASLALLPTVVSLLCTNAAIELIGSTGTAILGVFEPVTAVLFGILLFGERLTPTAVAGLVLILGCVTAVIARKR